MSFAGAADVAAQYPQYSTQIIAAAQESFLAGDQWAYLAGIIAVLLGATLVFFKFPHLEEEHRLLAKYQAEDSAATPPLEDVTPAPAGSVA
jgi:MFS transporter, DHA2 family, multidrug resistance protein